MLLPDAILTVIIILVFQDQAPAARIIRRFVAWPPCAAERPGCPGPPGPDQFPARAFAIASV
jgi:hypothetical protein